MPAGVIHKFDLKIVKHVWQSFQAIRHHLVVETQDNHCIIVTSIYLTKYAAMLICVGQPSVWEEWSSVLFMTL